MSASQERTKREESVSDRMKITALGLSYLLVGVGFFYSLVTDSIQLFTVALVGTLGLIFLSLFISIRREGLVTVENRIISVSVLLAMGLLFGLYEFTTLPSEVIFGIVFVVGFVVPQILLQYSSYGTPD